MTLVGRRFGRLTVLKQGPDVFQVHGPVKYAHRRTTWVCRCDCGKTCQKTQNTLTSKRGPRSCGCQVKLFTGSVATEPLLGKRFGMLLVVKEGPLRGKMKVTCRCDCGVISDKNRRDLMGGGTASCGCMNARRRAAITKQFRPRPVLKSAPAPKKGECPGCCSPVKKPKLHYPVFASGSWICEKTVPEVRDLYPGY